MRIGPFSSVSLGLSAAFTVLTLPAGAQDQAARCSHDSLNPEQARLRLEWARRCGLKNNVGSPQPANSAKRYDTGMSASNGGTLIEFYEDFETNNFWGLKTYTAVSVGFEVNSTYANAQWLTSPTSQVIEGGYEKWSRLEGKLKVRPTYPTFGTTASPSSGSPLYPHEHINLSDCTLYTQRSGGFAASSFYVNGYCTSSCYAPEQEVLMPTGYQRIRDSVEALEPEMMTLSPDATLDALVLQRNAVATYTTELWDTEHILYEIRTESGGLLRVTSEHPIVQGEGRMVQAERLAVGEQLVSVGGELEPIVSIERTTHHGKVYNLKPTSRDRVSNILVAQGYLVGSSAYQNEDVDYINRIIMFRSIPADAIPQDTSAQVLRAPSSIR